MISAARRENSRSLAGVRRNHIRSLTKSTVEIYMRGICIDFAINHYMFHTTPIVRNGEKKNIWICKLRPLNYLLQAASPLLSDKSLARAWYHAPLALATSEG